MYLQLYVVDGTGVICRLSQFIRPLNAFLLLFLFFDGWIHCKRPTALRVSKDVLKEPSKALIHQSMMTTTSAMTAFRIACLRSLRTRMSGAKGCRGRARRARTWRRL